MALRHGEHRGDWLAVSDESLREDAYVYHLFRQVQFYEGWRNAVLRIQSQGRSRGEEMTTTYLYNAELNYSFRRYLLDTCANCQKTRADHADENCLFEASQFQKTQLTEFFEAVFRSKNAELTLTCGQYTLKQRVTLAYTDDVAERVANEFRTIGLATLEIASAS